MSTVSGLDPNVAARLVDEGYGPGAWHGPNLKAALTDIAPRAAFWRPGPGRHNVAEIALHHAWCVRSVIGRLTGDPPEPFVLEGEDWFDVGGRLGWPEVAALVDEQQRRLAAVITDIGAGRIQSPLSERERFDLVLGITCHAVYHAGQVQLVKVLGAARA
ncbi:MAG: hypothetical protein DMD70_13125 [Gemmatimonadetes bacterium]|nr:MAG: hypothetical protein DMD70_13125 [Gemmatimonadota bacterium]